MELIEIATMTSKGQVTIPAPIRDIFNLKKGSPVIFKVTSNGVYFIPGEIMEKETYTKEEWGKIERMVAERGQIYKTAKGARRHIKAL